MEERKKRRGDRRDAYWVRDLDGLHTIMPHLMDKRTDAEVYVNMPFDVTETLRYIEGKNQHEEEYRATLFHCILMAVAKTVYFRPDLNRYISGRRYYQRYDITLVVSPAADTTSAMTSRWALWRRSGLRTTARSGWWWRQRRRTGR